MKPWSGVFVFPLVDRIIVKKLDFGKDPIWIYRVSSFGKAIVNAFVLLVDESHDSHIPIKKEYNYKS